MTEAIEFENLEVPDIRVYRISKDSKYIGNIRFDERSRTLLSGSVIVFDHKTDAFHLLAYPSEESIAEAKDELFTQRQRLMEFGDKQIKRG